MIIVPSKGGREPYEFPNFMPIRTLVAGFLSRYLDLLAVFKNHLDSQPWFSAWKLNAQDWQLIWILVTKRNKN